MRTSTGSISVTKMAQNASMRNRKRKYTIANADSSEIAILPTVIGINRMIAGGDSQNQWNLVMATAMLAMIPPALVVMLMQKWFVKGLVDTEK